MKFPIMMKNLRDLRREKTFVLLMLLMVFILLSVSILVATVAFIYNPEFLISEPIKAGIIGGSDIFDPLMGHQKLELVAYSAGAEARALSDFDEGSLDAVIRVQQAGPPAIIHLTVPNDPIAASVFLSIVKPRLEQAEFQLQDDRGALGGAVWPSQIEFRYPPVKGADTLFEIILGFMLPLIILVPAFVLGNLFVDNISQEFEEKNSEVLFSAVSPRRYVHEYLLMGLLINAALVAIFLLVISLRFRFLQNLIPVYLYANLFCSVLLLFSMMIVFIFRKKDISQIVYSFGILSIFLLSPFFIASPLHAITEMLLGKTVLFSFAVLAALAIVFYILVQAVLRKHYY